jgi:hypothetical protein
MLRFHLLLIAALLVCNTVCLGQNPDSKRINHWYFGFGAGLDFTGGAPVADTLGQINSNQGNTIMSDTYGNLLFYTDGRQVWNAQHDSMANGDINGYMFFGQSVQAPLAIPKPGSEHLYYIITSDGFSSTPQNIKGLQYHVVDMSLNGGLGAVVEKNVQLYALPSEQMCVTRHANTCDYWLIGHDRNSADYLAWQISPAGIDTIPVVSNIGLDYSLVYQYPGNANWTGGVFLKGSPQSDKLASVVHWRYMNSGHSDEIWLSDFDAATGNVSGSFIVPLDSGLSGFAFSANGNVFYAGHGIAFIQLDQFDVSVLDSIPVSASRLTVWSSGVTDLASDLELGPDGKLYGCTAWGWVLNKDSMAVIHHPDVLGPGCQVEQWGQGLNGRYPGTFMMDHVSDFSAPNAPEHSCGVPVQELESVTTARCWVVADGVVVDGLSSEAAVWYQLVNAWGQICVAGQLPRSTSCVLPLSGLASGHYVIHLTSPGAFSQALRFVNP